MCNGVKSLSLPVCVQNTQVVLVQMQGGSSSHARAEDLKESLEQELLDAQEEADAAAANREAAEKEMSQLQAQAEQLARQQAAFKVHILPAVNILLCCTSCCCWLGMGGQKALHCT